MAQIELQARRRLPPQDGGSQTAGTDPVVPAKTPKMRQRSRLQPSSWHISTTALLLFGALLPAPTAAVPYPRDDLHDSVGNGFLMPRQCAQYCGYDNRYCCGQGSTCYTSAGIAGCAAAAGGGLAWYTTTWTQTQTYTSTISSIWPAATTVAPADCVPAAGSGQIACGSICCASWQYCAYKGQCAANAAVGGDGGGATSAGVTYTSTITTNGQTITTQYSAPYRVTSGATVTQTTTGTLAPASTTTTSISATAASASTAGSLSPGAIAGIVIGVIAGIGLLLLICACCIVRGLWHRLLDIFGLGKKEPRRTTRTETYVEEERYSRHHGAAGSVHSRRENHGRWFGGGGGRPSGAGSRREKEKKKSNAGWLGLGAVAGTLALMLSGKNKKKDAKNQKTRSDVSSGYYTDSYTASSPSSASSRRTRDTRRSRATHATRVSQSRHESRAGSRRP